MIFQYDSWDLVIVFHILYLNEIYLWLFMHRRGTLWPCQSQMPIHWAQWNQRRTQGSEARRGSRAGGSAMAHFVRKSLPFVLLKEWWCSMAVKIQGISRIFQTLMMNLSLAYDVKVWKAATMLLFLHSEANGAVFWGKSGKIHRLCPLSQPHANRSDPIRVWISLDTVASGQGLEHWHSAKALLRICWNIFILLHNTTVFLIWQVLDAPYVWHSIWKHVCHISFFGRISAFGWPNSDKAHSCCTMTPYSPMSSKPCDRHDAPRNSENDRLETGAWHSFTKSHL